MAISKVEKLANVARADLETSFAGQPTKRRRSLRQMPELLATAKLPEGLESLAADGAIRGLATHLRNLKEYLQKESCLPEAICARFKYHSSLPQVLSSYRLSRRTWNFFLSLAKETDWDPEIQVPLIPYESLEWHDQLEEGVIHVEVMLDTRALEGMVVLALEGYLSPKQQHRKGYEIYGINLGMIREVRQRRLGSGLRLTRYVYVMHSQPQLSAEGGNGHVTPNFRSLRAILEATGAMYPQYQAIGDFHSHLYTDFTELDDRKGWEFSTSDEMSNMEVIRPMTEHGRSMQVSFILAIARSMRKVPRSHFRGLKNTLQLSLGDCRVVLAAYRSLESGRLTRANTRLGLSGIAR